MSFRDLEFSEKATYLGYPILRLAEELYFSAKRRYITVSNWMKTQLLDHFPKLRDSNVRVIHNSVDANDFTPGKEADREVVLFSGRLIAAKGVIHLVDAIPRVLRNHPDTVFAFAGPGNIAPYENRLRRLDVPRQNLLFLGYLKNRRDLLNAYRGCAVFVAPTLYENLPIRILEAMACAKPVVATNVCAIPEAIPSPQEGVLVPPKSSEALAEAISDLLSNPERRTQIGRRARQRVVERFDWAVNANRTANFYEEIAAS